MERIGMTRSMSIVRGALMKEAMAASMPTRQAHRTLNLV
jgi:hypothetical protein